MDKKPLKISQKWEHKLEEVISQEIKKVGNAMGKIKWEKDF